MVDKVGGKSKRGGKRPGSGRKKGTPNKLTKAVKLVFEDAFDTMQGDKEVNLVNWGKANPTEFYKLAARLIPAEINAKVSVQETAVDLLKRGTGGT